MLECSVVTLLSRMLRLVERKTSKFIVTNISLVCACNVCGKYIKLRSKNNLDHNLSIRNCLKLNK